MTQAFNLSQLANRVNTSGQVNAANGLFNQTPVANGGTGRSSVTAGAMLLVAGTSALTELAGTTPGLVISTSPTGWAAVPAISVGGGNYALNNYVSPAVWSKPGTLKAIKVTVIGGGGNGGNAAYPAAGPNAPAAGGGGGGGAAIAYFSAPVIPGSPITVTAGAGTNSFGSLVTGTVGGNAPNTTPASPSTPAGGANGIGTVSPLAANSITFNASSGNGGGLNVVISPNGSGGSGGTSRLINGSMFWGPTGARLANSNAPGSPNSFISGGGQGGGSRSTPGTSSGGTGGPGIVIIEEFY
jgi:hypothetical protein